MKTYTYFAFLVMMIFTACHQQPATSLKRIVFEAGDQSMISSAVNKKLETMSALYGNAQAYNAALRADGQHVVGEQFTLVTWKYHGNPYFEGSRINGELLSVERLHAKATAGSTVTLDYQVAAGTVLPVNGTMLDQPQRIQYILGYRPAVFPNRPVMYSRPCEMPLKSQWLFERHFAWANRITGA